jgi:amino acid transporter
MQNEANRPSRSRVRWVIGALAIIAVIVVAASFLASGDPDGLERVAEDQGFIGAGEGSPFSIIADYVFPGMDGPMATVVAGLIGVAIVLGLVWLVGSLLARRRSGSPEA